MATGVDAKLLKSTKFPPEFNQKVDMQKVNVQVMKKWIANRVTEILGSEDDVVIELVFDLVEGVRNPDIKSMQIQLTGFLDKDTPIFCKDLWKLLLSAQASPQGVPKELLEAKKLELMQEKVRRSRRTKLLKKPASDETSSSAATVVGVVAEGAAVETRGEGDVTIGTGAVLDVGDPDHPLVFVIAATAQTVEDVVVPAVAVVDGRAIFMFLGETRRGVAAVDGAITDRRRRQTVCHSVTQPPSPASWANTVTHSGNSAGGAQTTPIVSRPYALRVIGPQLALTETPSLLQIKKPGPR
ncbi:uncharacterized protein C8A04DRAFT_24475 [Dichotomopilus funicola]|uniref:PWI domain-containing protein n=1 Tax=Dichotomopilus funicola TaxID=1934379 RepID=A0AAN6VAJ7_9PEZI|nr:hypothetical protein C8A04DRAFT_24475 [Dichotomopilus funicola]